MAGVTIHKLFSTVKKILMEQHGVEPDSFRFTISSKHDSLDQNVVQLGLYFKQSILELFGVAEEGSAAWLEILLDSIQDFHVEIDSSFSLDKSTFESMRDMELVKGQKEMLLKHQGSVDSNHNDAKNSAKRVVQQSAELDEQLTDQLTEMGNFCVQHCKRQLVYEGSSEDIPPGKISIHHWESVVLPRLVFGVSTDIELMTFLSDLGAEHGVRPFPAKHLHHLHNEGAEGDLLLLGDLLQGTLQNCDL